MKKKINDEFSCDVWIQGVMQQDCLTIASGKKLMRELLKENKSDKPYMYSFRSSDQKSNYYFFDANNKIKMETNNLDN